MSSESGKIEDFEKEVELIDMVRDNPCIWDKSLDTYKSSILREKVWETIGGKLQWKAQDCDKLWRKLRSQYMGHQRKLKKPSGSFGTRRPYFRHEITMQFLKDTSPEEGSFSNLTTELESQNTQADSLFLEKDVLEASSGVFTEETAQTTQPNESNIKQFERRLHSKPKKPRMDFVDVQILNALKSTETEDEFTAFGNFVAGKLRKIHERNPKLSQDAQYFISTWLHENEMQILNE